MQENKKVSWTVFVWVIGIIIIVFGYIFTAISAVRDKVDSFNGDLTQIQVQLSQIQTDIVWIKNNLR